MAVNKPMHRSSLPQEKVIPNASPRFLFEIVINPHSECYSEVGGASFGGCSVVVEVEPEEAIGAFTFGPATRTARHFAEEVAQWAAVQAVQKDFPHGFEPACSASPLDRLPDELCQRHPIAHTRQARSWLV
jgi:hypothetical protein